MPCETDKLKEQFDLLFKEILELQQIIKQQETPVRVNQKMHEALKTIYYITDDSRIERLAREAFE